MTKGVQFILFVITKWISLFMDELSRAVQQFGAGGSGGGSTSTPPTGPSGDGSCTKEKKTPGGLSSSVLAEYKEMGETSEKIEEEISSIYKKNFRRPPGPYQREEIVNFLSQDHGAEKMKDILQSLQTEGMRSRYFPEILSHLDWLESRGDSEKTLKAKAEGG